MYTLVSLLIEILILAIIKSMTGNVYIPGGIVIACIVICTIAFCIDVVKSKTLQGVKGIIVFAYFARMFFLFSDIYLKGIIPVFGSGADTEDFFRRMVVIGTGGVYSGNHFFVRLFGYLFRFIGVSRLFAQYIIVLFSIVAIVFVVKSMNLLSARTKDKQMALILMAFLPNYVCLSSILLRESIIYMLISIAIYYFVKWYNGNKTYCYILSILFSLCAALFHSGSVGVTIGIILARIMYDSKAKRFRITIYGFLIGAVTLVVFVFLFNRFGDTLFYKISGIRSVADIAQGGGRGASSYAAYVGDSSNIFRLVLFTIPRIFFYLFSPLPWQWRDLSDIVAFVFSSLFYAFSIWKSINYVRKKKKANENNRNIIILLLVICAMAIFVFAWGTTNAGTALRHRDKIISVFVLMLSLQPWKIYFKTSTFETKLSLNTKV